MERVAQYFCEKGDCVNSAALFKTKEARKVMRCANHLPRTGEIHSILHILQPSVDSSKREANYSALESALDNLETQVKSELKALTAEITTAMERTIQVVQQAYSVECRRLQQHCSEVLEQVAEYRLELRRSLQKEDLPPALVWLYLPVSCRRLLGHQVLDISLEVAQLVCSSVKRNPLPLSEALSSLHQSSGVLKEVASYRDLQQVCDPGDSAEAVSEAHKLALQRYERVRESQLIELLSADTPSVKRLLSAAQESIISAESQIEVNTIIERTIAHSISEGQSKTLALLCLDQADDSDSTQRQSTACTEKWLQSAETVLKKHFAKSKLYELTALRRAQLAFMKGHIQTAEDYCRLCPQGEDHYWMVDTLKGAVQWKRKGYGKALELFRSASNLHHCAVAGNNEAVALVQTEELKDIEEILHSLLTTYGKHSTVLHNLGVVYAAAKKFDEAEAVLIDSLQVAERLHPTRTTQYLLGIVQGISCKFDLAHQSLLTAETADELTLPSFGIIDNLEGMADNTSFEERTREILTDILRQTAMDTQSEKFWAQFLLFDLGTIPPHYGVAELIESSAYQHGGDAVQWLLAALKQRAADAPQSSLTHLKLAELLLAQGSSQLALQHLMSSALIATSGTLTEPLQNAFLTIEGSNCRVNLDAVFDDLYERDEVERWLKCCIEHSNIGRGWVCHRLGKFLCKRHRYQEAEGLYTKVMSDTTDDMDTLTVVSGGLSAVYIATWRLSSAISLLESHIILQRLHTGSSGNMGAIFIKLGKSLERINRMKRAEECFQVAEKDYLPGSAHACYHLARLYLTLQRWQEALACLDRISSYEKETTRAKVWQCRAKALVQCEKMKAARECLVQLLGKCRNTAVAMEGFALLVGVCGRVPEEYREGVLEAYSSDPACYSLTIKVFIKALEVAQKPKAATTLPMIKQLLDSPQAPRFNELLALFHFSHRVSVVQIQAAKSSIDRCKCEYLNSIGNLYLRLKMYQEAEDAFCSVLKSAPNLRDEVNATLGLCTASILSMKAWSSYAEKADWRCVDRCAVASTLKIAEHSREAKCTEELCKLVQAAVAGFDPEDSLIGEMWSRLGKAHYEQRQLSEAMQAYEHALRHLESSAKGLVRLQLGKIHRAQRNPQGAIDQLAAAQQLISPRYLSPLCYLRGKAYVDAGSYRDAVQQLKAAVESSESSRECAKAALALGVALSRQGKVKEGKRWLKLATKKSTDAKLQVKVYNCLLDLCIEMQWFDKAEQYLRSALSHPHTKHAQQTAESAMRLADAMPDCDALRVLSLILDKFTDEKVLVEANDKLMKASTRLNDIAAAERYYEATAEMNESIDSLLELLKYYISQDLETKTNECLHKVSKMINRSEGAEIPMKAGAVLFELRKDMNALLCFQIAERRFSEEKANSLERAKTILYIGQVEKRLGNKKIAEERIRTSLAILSEHYPNSLEHAKALCSLSQLACTESRQLLDRALEILTSHYPHSEQMADCHTLLAQKYRDVSHILDAKDHYKSALLLRLSLFREEEKTADLCFEYAAFLVEMKRWDKVEKYIEMVMDIRKTRVGRRNKERLEQAAQLLAEVKNASGSYQN